MGIRVRLDKIQWYPIKSGKILKYIYLCDMFEKTQTEWNVSYYENSERVEQSTQSRNK